ncbi:MAG: hypothetical protein P4L33_04485 [Capsulimonadaceae bacterium]|nr:hypothetical protein [Capsulimonadaceae bacterium]
MPHSLQDFLVRATPKAAEDLIAAYERLPEDKRGWSAMDKARSANDQLSECAILNGYSVQTIRERSFTMPGGMEAYQKTRLELAADPVACRALFDKNLPILLAAVGDVPDADLGNMIEMPWGALTVEQVIAYPYWNMIYHEGQINFIASMLGCLD